jgi:uncharacterized membrane protein
MIEAPLALAALVAGITALSFWLDRHVRFLSRVGAGMLAILLAAILSNAGLVPAQSPVYDVVGGTVTSLAIAWLLLAVDLADMRRVGARALLAFAIACVATAAGALAGAALLHGRIGPETWKLTGVFTATYTGGGVNFVAVGRGLNMSDALFVGATAADNVTTALWLAVTLTVPLWLGRGFAPIPAAARGEGEARAEHPYFTPVQVSTLDLALLVAIGFGLITLAGAMASLVPAVHSVLWLTTLALLVGHIPAVRRTRGALQLGNLALLCFFVTIGIHSRIDAIITVGIEVFWFTVLVVLVHGFILFGLGRLFGFDIAILAIASQASVGGPSSALAVAVTREWPGLVLPAVVLGLLGYAIGNYLGFAMAWVARALGLGMG